jgi:hypothetical protein
MLGGAIGSEFSKLHAGTSHGIKIGAITTKCGVSMEKKREDRVHWQFSAGFGRPVTARLSQIFNLSERLFNSGLKMSALIRISKLYQSSALIIKLYLSLFLKALAAGGGVFKTLAGVLLPAEVCQFKVTRLARLQQQQISECI